MENEHLIHALAIPGVSINLSGLSMPRFFGTSKASAGNQLLRFQHAIKVAWSLAIRYLWIGCLCIFQNYKTIRKTGAIRLFWWVTLIKRHHYYRGNCLEWALQRPLCRHQ